MVQDSNRSDSLWEKIKAIRNVTFPAWIKIVGLIYFLLGIMIFYSCISFLFVNREIIPAIGFWQQILFGLAAGGGVSLVGYKIIKLKNVPWRIIGIILAVFHLGAPPLGTFFGISTIFILIRGKSYFE